MFTILWNQGDVVGYVDLLPSDWFEPEARQASLRHLILPRGEIKPIVARCSLLVKKKVATLDYGGQHSRYNVKHGIDLGRSRLTFSDETFSEIVLYEWAAEGDEYAPADVAIGASSLAPEEAEGSLILVSHMKRERDPGLARRKIRSVITSGNKIRCEACGFSFEDQYGPLGMSFCEVHHRNPLAEGFRFTKPTHLALLCANCHRMIHRAIKDNPSLTVEQFAASYVNRKWLH